jgi:hypothetical protein
MSVGKPTTLAEGFHAVPQSLLEIDHKPILSISTAVSLDLIHYSII